MTSSGGYQTRFLKEMESALTFKVKKGFDR